MKKLLLFSILFLTCSLGIKSVSASSLDMSTVPSFDYDLFNVELNSTISSTGYLPNFKKNYSDVYSQFKDYVESNYKYYIWALNYVYFWNDDDIEVLGSVIKRNNTSTYKELQFYLYDPNDSPIWRMQYLTYFDSKNISYVSRFNSTSSISLAWSTKEDNNYFSGSFSPKPSSYIFSGFETNASIKYDSQTLYDKGLDYTFYNSAYLYDKIYSSGDYIFNGSNKISNPKISLKYLTTTGDDTGSKIGATVSIDFNTFDKSRYSYLISFDNGNSWDGLTPRMTSSTYTFSKLENFSVIAQLYDTETDKSYYSTLLVDKIDMSYHSKWIEVVRNSDKDLVLKDDTGNDFLYSSVVDIYQQFNSNNNYPLKLFYSYDSKNWKELTNFVLSSLTLDKNTTIYFMYRDVANQVVFRSTYTVDWFSYKEQLKPLISFDEWCSKESCSVTVYFTNYSNDYNYYVMFDGQYTQINKSQNFNGIYEFPPNTNIQNFCAKVVNSNNVPILEKCYMSYGVDNSFSTSISGIISGISGSIAEFMNVIRLFYVGLPVGITNLFSFIFFIGLAVLLIKILL